MTRMGWSVMDIPCQVSRRPSDIVHGVGGDKFTLRRVVIATHHPSDRVLSLFEYMSCPCRSLEVFEK